MLLLFDLRESTRYLVNGESIHGASLTEVSSGADVAFGFLELFLGAVGKELET